VETGNLIFLERLLWDHHHLMEKTWTGLGFVLLESDGGEVAQLLGKAMFTSCLALRVAMRTLLEDTGIN
jgi:hypothetical protein